VKVFLRNEPKPVLSINSLRTMEQKLPSSRFIRIHRSFIINLERVETIERNRIVFGSVYIPISDQNKEKFQSFLDENFL
jgi:two-component system, LytTR family, response regulator LytT